MRDRQADKTMAHTASNMISGIRAQFATDAHSALSNSHGHHFAYHAPPPLRRQPQKPRELSEMMHTPVPDPEAVLAKMQKKVSTHNARLQERIKVEAAAATKVAEVSTKAVTDEIEEATSDEEDGK